MSRKLYFLHLLYLLNFWGLGAMVPFQVLVIKHQGLSDSDSMVAMIGSGLGVILGPMLLGFIADKTRAPRETLSVAFLVTGLLTPLFFLISTSIDSLMLVAAHAATQVSVIHLADQKTLSQLSDLNIDRSYFQTIRRTGSIGFLVPSLLLGLVHLLFSSSSNLELYLALSMSSLAYIFASLLTLYSFGAKTDLEILSRVGGGGIHGQPGMNSNNLRKEIESFVRSSPVKHLILSGAFIGISTATFVVLTPRYFQSLGLGASEAGLLMGVGVFLEIIFMPYTYKIIAAIGEERLILIGMFSAVFRTLITALSTSIWLQIAACILHPPFVLGIFVTVPGYIARITPSRLQYSVQGIFASFHLGVGRIFACIIGAIALQETGLQSDRALLQNTLVTMSLIALPAAFWFAWITFTSTRSRV